MKVFWSVVVFIDIKLSVSNIIFYYLSNKHGDHFSDGRWAKIDNELRKCDVLCTWNEVGDEFHAFIQSTAFSDIWSKYCTCLVISIATHFFICLKVCWKRQIRAATNIFLSGNLGNEEKIACEIKVLFTIDHIQYTIGLQLHLLIRYIDKAW